MLTNPESRAHILSMIKLGHVGEPMDAAAAIVFLASPAAAMITGTTPPVMGVDGALGPKTGVKTFISGRKSKGWDISLFREAD